MTTTATSKEQLITSITDSLVKAIAPIVDDVKKSRSQDTETKDAILQLTAKIDQLNVVLSSIEGRLQVIESMVTEQTSGGKKAVKTGSISAAKAAAKTTASDAEKAPAVKPAPKLSNAMLFLRFAMTSNYQGLRDKYMAMPDIETYKSDPSVTKHAKPDGNHPSEYYNALGQVIWKILSPTEKTEVRNIYTSYKDSQAKAEGNGQLGTEDEASS